MTLYLKYRPRSFADVVGQDHVVTTLEHAAERGQLSHAYLFCGTRGTGKTSVARILAKILLIRGMEDERMQEQIVRAVEEGSLVDLTEIDAASNRRIDDVRELIEKIQFSPVVAKAKVYIIDEVHMLTKEAFNALLKTLEEPPEYAYFILATTELHKVPETIQSRCQRFLFKRVREDDIVRRLQYIVDQEHIKADREALRAIAHHATGSFRDAISLLDQLRSLEHITLADVAERLGTTINEFIEEIVSAIDAEDASKIPAIVRKIEESNASLELVLEELLTVLREGMHTAVETKQSLSPSLATMDVILSALRDLRASPVPGLVLEAALLTLCLPGEQGEGVRETKRTALQLAPKAPKKAASQPAEPKPSEKKSSPEIMKLKSSLVEAEELSLKSVAKHWADVIKNVQTPSVRMSLKNGVVSDVAEQKIVLSFPSAFHRDNVAETAASRAIEGILERIFKRSVHLECLLEQPENAHETTGPATDLVDAAQEVFGSRSGA